MAIKQNAFPTFKRNPLAYGGQLSTTRKGRATGRPLSFKHSLHLVLRSSQAKGAQSFAHNKNRKAITEILQRFATKYGITIHSLAINFNHMHMHLKLSNRVAYKAFIRAITASIAMKITGASRWKPGTKKFWDRRPFSRVVVGQRQFLTLKNYIEINQLEGHGHSRAEAKYIIERYKTRPWEYH